MKSSLFHIDPDGTLAVMEQKSYESEDHIQKLLAQHPEILAGEQFGHETPRRWVLVAREYAIRDGETGGSRWSLDHLFLDQDAVPTLVEVKRHSDTRSRREVVGQMFDYAANGPAYWSIDDLQESFEATQQARGHDPDEVLHGLIGDDAEPDAFWEQVEANLRAGRIRMVFLVDEMPAELLRIVEFLNRHLQDPEVYAVEVRQHVGPSGRILESRVMGQTLDAKMRRNRPRGGDMSEEEWLAKFRERHGHRIAETAEALISWMKANGSRTFRTPAMNPAFGMLVDIAGSARYPLFIKPYAKVDIVLGYLQHAPAFADEARRQEVVNRLNGIDGVEMGAVNLQGDAQVPIELLVDESRRNAFLDVVRWIIEELRAAETPEAQ